MSSVTYSSRVRYHWLGSRYIMYPQLTVPTTVIILHGAVGGAVSISSIYGTYVNLLNTLAIISFILKYQLQSQLKSNLRTLM